MDEQERQVLQAKLAKVDREWERLGVVRDYLRSELGLVDDDDSGSAAAPPVSERASGGDLTVNAGEFFATSATKAAKVLLERSGRQKPLKTGEIYEAITKGGVKLASEGVLYRSLTRDDDFIKVGRGVWGLSAWYPNAPRKGQRASSKPDGNGAGSSDDATNDGNEDDAAGDPAGEAKATGGPTPADPQSVDSEPRSGHQEAV